jgi:hypothetical protein
MRLVRVADACSIVLHCVRTDNSSATTVANYTVHYVLKRFIVVYSS